MDLFHGPVDLMLGDCLERLDEIDDCYVDSIVTDPPYGIGFMGKHWDHGVPGVDFWAENLRVAKPGSYLLAFGGTRKVHRLACAIEDAGWEIRDRIMWVYGTGFPKSLNVSKAIDAAAGAERKIVGYGDVGRASKITPYSQGAGGANDTRAVTAPATDAAKQWAGWGTALKPAYEPIIMARKPLIGTVASNVLEYGCGGINIDGCRIPGIKPQVTQGLVKHPTSWDTRKERSISGPPDEGRWPANFIHDGSEEVVELFPSPHGAGLQRSGQRDVNGRGKGMFALHGAGAHRFGDQGSAARFFYCAKASRAERDEGLQGAPVTGGELTNRTDGSAGLESPRAGAGRTSGGINKHPTVKPLALMRYLCRLVTPPGGMVLDPFMGSGSTGRAAIQEGFEFLGIELEEESYYTAMQRIFSAVL